MTNAKSLDGKVVIVTGAGRGIGREIALLCAAEGAKVVVNDPGGAADGSGTSAAPAEEVVEEISKRGGTAVANFETVAEAVPASRIVKTAIDSFGRLDGVVNNAGILRDAIFHRMSVDAFESVIKVHLMGSFYVSHAAARHVPRAGKRRVRAFHLDLRPDRQFRPGQLCRGQARHRRPVEIDRARHGALQCPLQLRVAVRLEPADRHHSDRDRGREGAGRARSSRWDRKRSRRSAAFLLSDAAKDVTGQIFAVRMNEIFLMGQSRPLRSIHRAEGWTPQTIAEHGMPALKSSFYKLDRSADIFNWDAI